MVSVEDAAAGGRTHPFQRDALIASGLQFPAAGAGRTSSATSGGSVDIGLDDLYRGAVTT